MRKQLDKNLSFHKLVAYMIALMTGELKGDHSRLTRVEYFQKIRLKHADSHTLKTLVCLPCSSSFFLSVFQPVHLEVE